MIDIDSKYKFTPILSENDVVDLQDETDYIVLLMEEKMACWAGYAIKEDFEYIRAIFLPCEPVDLVELRRKWLREYDGLTFAEFDIFNWFIKYFK